MQGQDVTYLVAAYAIIWAALFAYLAFIVMRLRGVRTELAAVQELVHEREQKEQARKSNLTPHPGRGASHPRTSVAPPQDTPRGCPGVGGEKLGQASLCMSQRVKRRVFQRHACAPVLEEQYGLIAVTLEFLPRGLDYNAGVYRVVSEQGTAYLLKVKSGALYEPGCLVPAYLHEQGIAAVVAPLPTRQKALWTQLDGWTAIVYPFIEGDTSWTGMTDAQWQDLGRTFKQIHNVAVAI